jgi:hypothetical protein
MIESTPPIPGAPDPAATDAYRAALATDVPTLRTRLSARFTGKEFVVVRGFLTDLLDRAGLMMSDQLQAITALGCRVRKVQAPFDSENAPDVNATELARMLKSASQPVVFVTHSKGSVDALATLVNYPELRGQMAGWVSIQGAVQGSPVADFLVGQSSASGGIVENVKRATLESIFRHVFNGSLASLDALRTRDRVQYLTDNATEIGRIVGAVPTVAFGSAAPTSRSVLRTLTDPFFHHEPRNDGLVPVERSVIPGAHVVHDLDGPDHADAVIDVPGPQGWDRVRLTYALLSALP